ncbi:MAG: 16S rRNA (guanine(527)-N(7))-methyltransferase RsmG [Jatrophihabitantaceae bacterium]
MMALEVSPARARAVFGERVELAERYATLLTGDAVTRGLLGPREPERIWERHLLNCAVLSELLPPNARLVDVGSGAGLPGLAVAIRRPDLRVELVEPAQRRVEFLSGVIDTLGLADAVRVVRGRAEEPGLRAAVGDAAWVTARAVAPLDRLVGWCLPLLQAGGHLLAMKGTTAEVELGRYRAAIERAGGRDAEVVACGASELSQPTLVVVIRRAALPVTRGNHD